MIKIVNKLQQDYSCPNGEILQPNDNYIIPSEDINKFATSDGFISSLTINDLDFYYNEILITSLSEKINIIKNLLPQKVEIQTSKPFADSYGFRARFQGIEGTIAQNESIKNIDLTLTEERFINGIRLMIKGQSFGDKIDLSIVDKNYTYAGILYPASYNGTPWSQVQPDGVVLDKFGLNWFVAEDQQLQPDVVTPYPARIMPGMTIRITYYRSEQVNDIYLKANLYLHWKTS